MRSNNPMKISIQHFAMKNKDLLAKEKTEILQRINAAIKEDKPEELAQAWEAFCGNIQEQVLAEAKELVDVNDINVLAARGVRQLTSEERTYYEKVQQAMKSSNPKQALADLDVVMPKTVIDGVFDDLVQEHPLLEAIDFQNTSGLIEYLVNTDGTQLATWSALTAEIVKELTGGFKKIPMTLQKLSAFLPVAKAMLDLGPQWLDRYVRLVLGEALYNGLEEGIVNGTGKDMPIGMNRQVGEGVTVTDGVYPVKAAVAVTKLDPVTYGDICAGIAHGPNGKVRKVPEVILVVNPVDYLRKIMPATTIRGADGRYVNDVFPYPTKVIPSIHVPEGRAILGLGKRYFMGAGTSKSGKIEYSDDYRFLEDERVYLVKFYGHGEPLDNTAFAYLDISGLQPAVQQVYVTNAADFPGADIPEA